MSKLSFSGLLLALATLACAPAQPVAQKAPNKAGLHKHHPEYRRAEMSRDARAFANLAPSGLDVESYDFDASFDWDRNELNATTTVKLKRTDASAAELKLDSTLTEVFTARVNGRAVSFHADAATEKLVLDVGAFAGVTELEVVVRYRATAAARSAIRAIAAREGDPIQSRVVYTHSEPLGAREWMPCNDAPSDRAHFRARFTMPDSESFIANGDLRGTEVTGEGFHRTSYATRNPIPTYVMAWATGEMQAAQTEHGRLPVAIWSRKGSPADVNGLLAETVHQIKHFEALVGPYPHEKYAIVLLPDMGGGEENVGITFNDEASSSQSTIYGDRSLMAHELGHQWFGDYVTVEGWDDLWIKEGMATLLAAEGLRADEDLKNTGSLFGLQFWATKGEAVRDPNLHAFDKYTSGPYDRAAWVLTQIRSVLGERDFWATLRQVLRDRAHGSINTEDFLAYFAPFLGQAGVDQIRRAIHAHDVPALELSRVEGAQSTTLALRDPENILIAPLELSLAQADGLQVRRVLGSNESLQLPDAHTGLVFDDPRDVHPEWINFIIEGGTPAQETVEAQLKLFGEHVAARSLPKTEAERTQLLNAGPRAQLNALGAYGSSWIESAPQFLEAASFGSFVASLDSQLARFRALQAGCRQALEAGGARLAAWRPQLAREFQRPALRGAAWTNLGSCRAAMGPSFMRERFDLLAAEPASPLLSEVEVFLLSKLTLPSAETLQVWEGMAFSGISYRNRATALRTLSNGRAAATAGNAEATELEAYAALFRRALDTNVTNAALRFTLPEVLGSGSPEALPVLARFLPKAEAPVWIRRRVLCGARALALKLGGETEWNAFRTQVDTSRLEPALLEILDNPARCEPAAG
jgi:aminopeptidase N